MRINRYTSKFEVNKEFFDQYVKNIKGFRKVSRHNGQYHDEVDKYNNTLEYQYKYFEEINFLDNDVSINSSYYFRDNKFKAVFLKFYFKNLKKDSILISNFFKHEHLEFLKTNVYGWQDKGLSLKSCSNSVRSNV